MINSPKDDRQPLPEHIKNAALEMWRESQGLHLIPIHGSSMLPLILDGDQLLISYGVKNFRRGDLVVFQQKGELIAHRLLSKKLSDNDPTFMTKGDNVLRPDPLIPANEILGKVLMIHRGEQQLSLDTAVWQWIGWFIATIMLVWTKVHSLVGKNTQIPIGSENDDLRSSTGRKAKNLFTLFLKGLLFIFARWKS